MPKAPVSEITALSDQAIAWVVRLQSGLATQQDVTLAKQWQNRSPSHRKAFAEAEQLWLEMGESLNLTQTQFNPHKPLKPSRIRTYQWRGGLAAALVMFALIAPFSHFTDRWFSDYATVVGEQKTVTLADGSRVLLNTDTAISVAYTTTGRKITLQHGQAVFTVAADRNRPFEVATDTAVVKALGTVFEVREEPEDTRILVIEHAVNVKGLHEPTYQAASRISAGQQARYSRTHGLEGLVSVDSLQNTAWQRGKLIFKNQPLATVVAELDRYYQGKITIINRQLDTLRVTGVFPVNDPAATLAMIEQTLPIKITRVTPWLTFLHS